MARQRDEDALRESTSDKRNCGYERAAAIQASQEEDEEDTDDGR